MFKQSLRRNQRSKGLKIKHVLQIGLLLGVCFWLLYQVKHSHDKKSLFADNVRASDALQIENDVVKLGRKDLPRQKEGSIIRDDQQKEDEEEEENKNEEEHNKLEDVESAGKGGEEDDLHRDELKKTEDEVNGKGYFDDKEVRDGGERNNGQDILKEHEDSQEDNKGEDNEKPDEVSQKESEEGKEDGEENDENGGESLEKVSEESNGKEVSEKNEVEENNENEVEENKENSENGNTENEKENQVNENESEMKVEEGKSSEEKENEEKEKEESKAEKEKSEEHEPEQEQSEDNRDGRAEDKDGHIEQVVSSENQVQDGNDSHNQGAREEHYKNDDASSAVVHETQHLNESDSGHSENIGGEVHMEFKEKFETENENRGTFESNQENKDTLEQENKENHESEQENKENREQENKEFHESQQENKEKHEGEQESKENPEREQESKENRESKENHESEQEENKENNEAEQENMENNETEPENKEENTDLNQIESASIINGTQSVEKNNTSYSFMDTTLDSAHNQNELNPVLDAALNHTEKVATDEKSNSSVTLTTAENQGSTSWNSTHDSGKVSSEDQIFSSNSSEGTENDDTSHHTGIGGNEVHELSNRVEKLESNEETHVDSAKEELPSTFSENKQNENERTLDSRENSNADKISEGDEEASLNTNSGQEPGQHESGNSSLPEHEKEAQEDLETLPESTIAGHTVKKQQFS